VCQARHELLERSGSGIGCEETDVNEEREEEEEEEEDEDERGRVVVADERGRGVVADRHRSLQHSSSCGMIIFEPQIHRHTTDESYLIPNGSYLALFIFL